MRPTALWTLLGSALAALVVDLSSIHEHQNGDSLVLVLTSLVQWTPMYWEQDRFGMLIPLLARPFTHPLANLLVQGWLNAFAHFAALFLAARYCLRHAAWPIAAALTAALFWLFTTASYQFNYAFAQPIGVSTALGVGALLLAELAPQAVLLRILSLAGAMGCAALAHWVNLGTFLVLVPMAAGRTLFEPDRREWRRLALAILVIFVGTLVGWLANRLGGPRATVLGAADVAHWPAIIEALAQSSWNELAPHRWSVVLFALALLSAIGLHPKLHRRAVPAWRAAAVLLVSALVSFLFVGTREWVRINGGSHRYVATSFLLAHLALGCAAAVPLTWLSARWLKLLAPTSAATLVTVALAVFGPPSVAKARQVLELQGRYTPDILSARVTHVVGNYWSVWPAVFHARLTMRERGEGWPVYGLSHRSWATEELWSKVKREEQRFGALRGDPEAEKWLAEYGFQDLEMVEERATMTVLRRR